MENYKEITPEIWESVKRLFQSALDLEVEQRPAFLKRTCADPSIRAEVERLLAHHDKAGGFLADPVIGGIRSVLVEPSFPLLVAGAVLASRFEIIRFVAEGGMGEVYEAEDLELHERLGIKTLRSALVQQQNAIDRFKREVHLARKVTHPNVCRIFDLYRDKSNGSDVVFVTMEFLRGETLAERIKRQGRMTTREALPLIVQMSSALGAAHLAGIVHRDFKPGNVVLADRPDGVRAVVTDFGLAFRDVRLADSFQSWSLSHSISAPGLSYGTPAYMAPEQVEGHPATTSSDIYALGLVIYEMVTGARPFTGDTPMAAAVRRLVEAAPTPRKFDPTLSQVWESVILSCLERDPEKRFANAEDVAKALETGETPTVGRSTSGYRWPLAAKVAPARRIAAPTRKWVISAAAFVVLCAIAIGAYTYRSRSASFTSGRAPLYASEFTNSTGDTSFDYVLRDIVANELNRSPAVQVVAPSEEDLADLLQKAGKDPEDSLTPDFARELCERVTGRFFTEGKIEPEGGGYGLELSVRECKSGGIVVQQRAAARDKDDVIQVASQLAAAIRRQLSGKSANSSDNTPAPLPTASLEAYKTYLLGERFNETQLRQSAAMLRRAVELDPSFAKAWEDLSLADYKLNDQKRDDDDLSHAFALREKLTANERTLVEARYHWEVTGEIYKAIEDLQTLEKLQPNEFGPRNMLALAYSDVGMYEKATAELRKNKDLFPDNVLANSNLSVALSAQSRYDEAESVIRQIPVAQAVGFSDHAVRYQLAMLQSDRATLETERNWMEQNADEPLAISFSARINLCEGRLEGARNGTQHAVNVSFQSGMSESAAHILLNLAQGEALYGQSLAARQTLVQAMKLSDSKQTKEGAVRVMILNGQEREAQKIMRDLLHEYPTDTFLNELDSPLVLAASQLASGQAGAALRTLNRAKPFEFGRRDGLLSNYVRALAYLRLRRLEDATGEFSAILVHRGLSPLSPILVASQLGLARAYALQGDIEKSRTVYETFFAGREGADSELSILKEAKAEYAKLR
jgi:serine/threonine protein kinase/tetratricopeptide (TPR) repeat protein